MKYAPSTTMRFASIALQILVQLALVNAAAADFSIEPAIDSIRAIQKQFIVCDGNCPSYLGLITLYFTAPSTKQDVQQFEQCLSTLIAPDEILTNQHCIPPLPMQKYIRVLFPKAGSYPAESVKIKSVTYESNIFKNPLLDYATIKLDRALSRPPALVKPTKLAKGDGLNLFAHSIQMNEKPGANFVKLTMKKCLSSESSQAEGRHDVTLRLSECITNDGDSGGPMIDPNGNIAGIVWGGGQSDTYGVNLACVQNPSDSALKIKCTQSIEDAAFRLVQSLAFQEIFEVQKFGSRAPVSEDITGGKLFVSALSCFSELPNEPVEIKETAVFVDQQTLTQKTLPLEAPSPFNRLPTILKLQSENDHLLVEVLNQDHSPLFSYRPERCP